MNCSVNRSPVVVKKEEKAEARSAFKVPSDSRVAFSGDDLKMEADEYAGNLAYHIARFSEDVLVVSPTKLSPGRFQGKGKKQKQGGSQEQQDRYAPFRKLVRAVEEEEKAKENAKKARSREESRSSPVRCLVQFCFSTSDEPNSKRHKPSASPVVKKEAAAKTKYVCCLANRCLQTVQVACSRRRRRRGLHGHQQELNCICIYQPTPHAYMYSFPHPAVSDRKLNEAWRGSLL